MGYVALYRKYRPTTFDDVIGQEHITRTLINQINSDKVSHAYLFTGSRGTGKTSCAKIWARAINCLAPVNGSPCGKCEVCQANLEQSLDIMEIDAASNNKVDEVRELREHIKYLPSQGKYKVYIIDEAHMLTDSAFNALLKTLEEPPAHAVFILATTEAHKLPSTILSRCLRFDFRLVPRDMLARHVEKVIALEGKTIERNAAQYIATMGEGSVRDTLSLADTVLSFGGDNITLSDVLESVGATDRSDIFTLCESVLDANIGASLTKISEAHMQGKSMTYIAKEMTAYFRNLLVCKTTRDCDDLIADSNETIALYKEKAVAHSLDSLASCMSLFSGIDSELRYSVSPRLVLETACIKACYMATTDISSLVERLTRLENNGVAIKEVTNQEVVADTLPDKATVWGKIAIYIRENESMAIHTIITSHTDYDIVGRELLIYTDSACHATFATPSVQESLARAIRSCNYNLTVRLVRKDTISVDNEIERIKAQIGKAHLEVKK